MKISLIGLLLALLSPFIASMSAAQSDDYAKVQFHGFASQSFLYSNKNKFFGNSDDGSFKFYELGANVSWELSPKFRFSGQILIRDAGSSDNGKDRIDYAFGEYIFFDDESSSAGVRVGRVINHYGFFNSTRDVTATRPSILLPQSIYVDANRSFAISADGVQLHYSKAVNKSQFSINAERIKPRKSNSEQEASIFGAAVPGVLEGNDSSWLVKLAYDYDFGRWQLAWTQGKVYQDYNPADADVLLAGKAYFKPMLLSVQYQVEKWGVTAEYLRRNSGGNGFGIPSVDITGDSFFVQADYRNANLMFFMRYDQLIRDNDDRWGRSYESTTGRPAYTRYAKDWTVGGRWDITQNFSVNSELHIVEGVGWLSTLENMGLPRSKNWNLFLTSISFRF